MLNNTPTEIEALVESIARALCVYDGCYPDSAVPCQWCEATGKYVPGTDPMWHVYRRPATAVAAALSARPSREAVLRDALAGRLRRIRDAAKDRATNAYERGRFDAACEVLAALLGEPNAIALGEKEEA